MNEIWATLMVDGGDHQDDFINTLDGGCFVKSNKDRRTTRIKFDG